MNHYEQFIALLKMTGYEETNERDARMNQRQYKVGSGVDWSYYISIATISENGSNTITVFTFDKNGKFQGHE